MKKIIILGTLALGLVGCDNSTSPQAFTPEMASFSNEFDFDPMRGPVKDFSQTLMNEQGQVLKRVSGSLSEEGCFDSLEFHDLENNSGASLALDANYYVDQVSREKRVRLQGKCQLAELPAAGISYDTEDNDFVIAAKGKDVLVTYKYDSEGYPLGKVTKSKDSELAIVATAGVDKKKKLDYSATTSLNGKIIGVAKQTCDYDSHFNSLSCDLEMTDDSVTPPTVTHYTIKNTVEYY